MYGTASLGRTRSPPSASIVWNETPSRPAAGRTVAAFLPAPASVTSTTSPVISVTVVVLTVVFPALGVAAAAGLAVTTPRVSIAARVAAVIR